MLSFILQTVLILFTVFLVGGVVGCWIGGRRMKMRSANSDSPNPAKSGQSSRVTARTSVKTSAKRRKTRDR